MSDLREQLQSTLGASYTFERELGGGGMARVFVATEASLGRRVVVKVLPPELAEGVSVDRFKREIQFAAQLQHAHIVPVLSAGDVDGLPYFTMPFVDGESLRARLARGELPMNDVVSILRDVARALDAAHAKGVIHRDIKPDNVLLSGGAAVVTDFGVAKAIASAASVGERETLTVRGIALGTPLYMAPEQAAADPRTDHRADIYAFGTMAYEMVAGRPPFGGRLPQQLAAAHATETPVSLAQLRPAVPAALGALVMRCLAKSPADRPQSAREILAAFDSIATPVGGSDATARPWSRRRVALTLTAAVAIVAIVAAAVFASRGSSRAPLDPKHVMVLPFENLNGDTTLSQVGRITAEWIGQGIRNLDSVRVVSSLAMASMADAKGRSFADVRQLAQSLKAGTVISGTFYRQGDSLHFHGQATRVSTGDVAMSIDGVVGPVGDPMVAIRTLTERFMGGLSSTALPDSRGISLGYAPLYAAAREFERGQELFRQRKYPEAIPYFRRAFEIDSTFNTARVMYLTAMGNSRHPAVADSVTRWLESRRDRLTRWERTNVDYIRAWLDGKQETALELMRSASARDSGEWLWLYLTGLAANNRNLPRLAIKALEAVRNPSPDSSWVPYWTNLASAHHQLGDFETELRVANHADSLHPSELFTQRLRATASMGDTASVRRLIDSVATPASDPVTTRADWMYLAFLELHAHGHPKEANELLARARTALAEGPATAAPTLQRLITTAEVLLAMGRFDTAYTLYVDLARRDTTGDITLRARVGVAAAGMHDSATARRVLDEMAQGRRPYDRGTTELWSATIAAQLGDKELAVSLLKQAAEKGSGVFNAHRLTEFQQLKGFPPFEALLRPKG